MINKKMMNKAIRAYMIYIVSVLGAVSSDDLVTDVKGIFPAASLAQISGNLSATCCYFKLLKSKDGIVSAYN